MRILHRSRKAGIDYCCAKLKPQMNSTTHTQLNPLAFSILRVLSDGQFHSGEALAQRFKVSRTTIWTAIQAAEALHISIFSVRGRGYKLAAPLTFLDEAEIRKNCTVSDKISLNIYPELASTNSTLIQLANDNAGQHIRSGTCVIAEMQTAGKGRRGRQWASGLGTSLTFSLLWRFNCGAAGLSGLSLAVGVALIRALNELGVSAQLKWPNDVLIDKKKVAGILIELQGDMEGPSAAVIGVGINLRLPEAMRTAIDQPVTDIASQSSAMNVNVLMAKLLEQLVTVLTHFSADGFAPLQQEWQRYHAFQAQQVCLLSPDGSKQMGVAIGVSADGALLFENNTGVIRVISGEISLRAMSR